MPPAFGTRAFWEENALRPREEYKEWFAGYSELAPLLRRCCPTRCTVLHAGCGISSLSQDMYDDGYRHQLAFDFSEECMRQQQAACAARPQVANAVMDCTLLGLRPDCVDCVVDKGTLDALLCVDGDDEIDGNTAVASMGREVRRVLRHRGLWVVVSFNVPSEVVPIMHALRDAQTTVLVACQALFSGNGVLYVYACKLLKERAAAHPEDDAPRPHQDAALAGRGWLRAVHSDRIGLLEMGMDDCCALGRGDGEPDQAELQPLLEDWSLVPAVVLPGQPGQPGTEGDGRLPVDARAAPEAAAAAATATTAAAHAMTLGGGVLQLQERGLGAVRGCVLSVLGARGGLRTLDLRQNRLTALPAELGDLAALQTLNVDRNALKSLPEALGQLSALHTLTATHNQLHELPSSWRRLRALSVLRLQRNPLEPEQLRELQSVEWAQLMLNGQPIAAATATGTAVGADADEAGGEAAQAAAAARRCAVAIDEVQARALREISGDTAT